MSTATLEVLRESGAVDNAEDEFGEITFNLRPGGVTIGMQSRVRMRGLLAAEPTSVEHFRTAPRLDLVVELLRSGWAFGALPGRSRSLDSPLVLAHGWLMGSKARLAALVQQVLIFFNGIEEIYTACPHHYLVCLLQLEDLTPLRELGAAVADMKDDDFRNILLGQDPGARVAPEDAPAALALEDIADEMSAVVMPLVVRPTFARLPVVMTLDDGREVRVHFDKGSHMTNRPRALTVCRLHGRCRIDRFIDTFSSEKRCVAWFMAWHEAGTTIHGPDGAELHRLLPIDDAAVDAWEPRVPQP